MEHELHLSSNGIGDASTSLIADCGVLKEEQLPLIRKEDGEFLLEVH